MTTEVNRLLSLRLASSRQFYSSTCSGTEPLMITGTGAFDDGMVMVKVDLYCALSKKSLMR